MSMSSQALRYLVVVVLGLGLDLGLALMLVSGGASRSLASAAGLICGAIFNFILHRIWTFRTGELPPLMPQILNYAASLAMILPVRLAVLALLRHVPVPIGDALALFLATGVSFTVNFIVLKYLVFNRRADL